MIKGINLNYWLNISSFTVIELAQLLSNEEPVENPDHDLDLLSKVAQMNYKFIQRAIDDGVLVYFRNCFRINRDLLIQWLPKVRSSFQPDNDFVNELIK